MTWANGTDGEDAIDEVTIQFFTLFMAQAALAIVCFLLTFFFFPAKPKYAPSLSQAKKRAVTNTNVRQSYQQTLYQLITTFRWVPIAIAGGMVTGVFFSILTLINQIIKPTFADQSVSLFPVFNRYRGLIFYSRIKMQSTRKLD